MAFTLAHAAAAIPFRRTPLIVSAIVMGCFVPDFSYFLTLSPHRGFSHTVAGMFVLDLPLAMAALWVFHAFIKQPMLMFLPVGIRRRLTTSVNRFPFWPWKRLALIVLSILVGTATHLAWDAFTHHDTWIYQNWAFLRETAGLSFAPGWQMYKLLEYASSVVGLAVIAVWIGHWCRTTQPAPLVQPVHPGKGRAFVAVLPVLAALGGALRAYQRDGVHLKVRPILHFTTDMLISGIAIFLLGLLFYGVTLRQRTTEPVRV
jgi:hypothetical protein